MNKARRYNIDVDQFGRAKPYLSEHGQWVKRIAYDALSAEVERLRAALEPFAKLAELFDDARRSGLTPKTGTVMSWPRIDYEYELTVEHLRYARAALAGKEGE